MESCNCNQHLRETDYRLITEFNKHVYTIYQCENCNKYWIKRFFYLHEVELVPTSQTWQETTQIRYLEV